MLEFVLPAGGLRGIALVGTLMALRDRGLVPEIATGISVGAFAAYQAYSGLSGQEVQEWYRVSRNHFRSRSGIGRFLPPYDTKGQEVTKLCEPYLVDSQVFRDQGIQKLLVGYTSVSNFRFVVEDVLAVNCKVEAFQSILKSSTIPFVTHFTPHCQGAIDGGFRKLYFTSSEPAAERWLFGFADLPATLSNSPRHKVSRRIILRSPVQSLTIATNRELRLGFECGYEQGLKLDI